MADQASQFDRLKAALADRYRIERELGRGGMATVYLAEDLKHHRPVAIKVLKPELAASVGAERFLREIQIGAKLTHPTILAIHDSGEADGLLYYVMPYIEGESLRDRLSREGQLSFDDTVAITREVAEGLDHAHGLGVVHRDIKPENILLLGDHALIADFGIARAVTEAGGERLTETGLSMGTPAYMSPEQASASPHIDHRADIYALGCVVYEMLAGDPPFTASTPQAVLARQLADTVPSLRVVRKTVPPSAEAAVERALAKTAADRYETAAGFLQELQAGEVAPQKRRAARWVGAGAVAVAAAVLIVLGRPHLSNPIRTAAATEPVWLMVKPFGYLGPEDLAYVSAGLAEDVRSRLGAVSGLRIIARQTSMHYEHTDKTVQQLGQEVGVGYILDGTVQSQTTPDGASQLRLNVALSSTADGAEIWSATYDEPLTPGTVLDVQAGIATRAVEALGVALSERERLALASRPTQDSVAYEYFLRGQRARATLRESDARIALAMFEKAIEHDSNFTLAYLAASGVHGFLYSMGVGFDASAERLAMAEAALERARQLDPESFGVLRAQAWLHYRQRNLDSAEHYLDQMQRVRPGEPLYWLRGLVQRRQGEWDAALDSYQEAVKQNPMDWEGHYTLGQILRAHGRYEEALQEFDEAISLNPQSSEAYENKVGLLLAWKGSTEDARRVLVGAPPFADEDLMVTRWSVEVSDRNYQAALDLLVPGLGAPRRYFQLRAHTHELLGQRDLALLYYDSARVALEEEIQTLVPGSTAEGHRRSVLGRVYAALGRKSDALREAELAAQILPLSRDAVDGAMVMVSRADIYARTGEHEAALDLLEALASAPARRPTPHQLRTSPSWGPIRDHPRFQALLAKYEN